jgi:hypothetical protein
MTHRDTGQSVLFLPFDSCPGCSATGLLPQAAGDQTVFYCAACRSHWHVDLGWMHRVDRQVPEPRPRRILCPTGPADPGRVGSRVIGRPYRRVHSRGGVLVVF